MLDVDAFLRANSINLIEALSRFTVLDFILLTLTSGGIERMTQFVEFKIRPEEFQKLIAPKWKNELSQVMDIQQMMTDVLKHEYYKKLFKNENCDSLLSYGVIRWQDTTVFHLQHFLDEFVPRNTVN
jgi:hypothetical protein